VLRSVRLFRLFLSEQSDPDSFYAALARDAASQIAQFIAVRGKTVLDIGGGAGYVTGEFRSQGAHCYLFELDPAEMLSRGVTPAGAVLADGYWLPVRDGGADVCVSSNVLEHVGDPHGFIEEMVRVTKPGGLIYLSFTNWYSPWGGHEMSPWHYLGEAVAERRYVRKHGKQPKHKVGSSLFRVHVGQVLRMMRGRADVEMVSARPRYYPGWCRALIYIPGLREIATWNLLLILRRTG
jgi:ubiquinone/menaquinone biosynthesis C-methylase UbiE